jgi:hypothetical protein
MYSVGSNYQHHAQDPNAKIVRRCYINSVDYTRQVAKWPSISRDWNSVRAATAAIQLNNADGLFNFFTSDKTRLKDEVDLDYGIKYKSHNLLLWSHVLSGTGWANVNANFVVEAIANPVNGETDAWKMFDSTLTNTRYYISQGFAVPIKTGSDTYRAHFYAKQAESKAVRFEVYYSGVPGGAAIHFDVESGGVAYETNVSSYVTGYFTRPSTQGWYEIGVDFTKPDSHNVLYAIEITSPDSKSDIQYTGTGSDGLYLYGNQLQVKRYSESDRYFMTGDTRIEPHGMNLGTFTEVYSGDDWVKSTSIFVTNNATTAPDGSATASVIQNSNNSVAGLVRHTLTLTEEEQDAEDFYCIANWFMRQDSAYTRMINAVFNANSPNLIGHEVIYNWDQNSVTTNQQYRPAVSSGMSWISAGGAEQYHGGWVRMWATVRKPFEHDYFPNPFDTVRGFFYPSVTPNSGEVAAWGYSFVKGGRELLDGPPPYVAVHSDQVVYPSNAEDTINIFNGTVRAANFSRGKVKIQAKDKFRNLSERIVGTGESPIQINSITPSWLLFTLCSCYGGMSNVQSTNNPDIDWASVDSWDSHNGANSVNVKCDFRGMKVTEALKRLARMTRVAIYLQEDKVRVERWTIVNSTVQAIGDTDIITSGLSVNDENLTNRQWIFGDYDQTSDYFQFAVNDEDTPSQNSFGLHENTIKDQAIFYTTSVSALDTAQRIVSNESDPVDQMNITTIPSVIQMQIGESLSVTDSEIEIAGTYRIMGNKVDMDKNKISWKVDNSQMILEDPFILDTSSLGGTDVLT